MVDNGQNEEGHTSKTDTWTAVLIEATTAYCRSCLHTSIWIPNHEGEPPKL